MIDKWHAAKILKYSRIHGIKGNAFSYGNQIPSFSLEWANVAKNNIEKKSEMALSRLEDPGIPCKPEDFFLSAGFSSYADIDYDGKGKVLLDLGKPIPRERIGSADFLFDGGVIEHIPNIFQAMSNAVLLLKKGGLLIQSVPVTCYAGSYYNIDPMLLRDFYTLNGFEMLECYIYYQPLSFAQKVDLSKVHLKKIIRRNLPKFLLPMVARRSARLYPKSSAEAVSGPPRPLTPAEIAGLKSIDDMKRVVITDPFSEGVQLRHLLFGLPPHVHVTFIGIKRSVVDSFEMIKAPVQDLYPSAV